MILAFEWQYKKALNDFAKKFLRDILDGNEEYTDDDLRDCLMALEAS